MVVPCGSSVDSQSLACTLGGSTACANVWVREKKGSRRGRVWVKAKTPVTNLKRRRAWDVGQQRVGKVLLCPAEDLHNGCQ